MPAPKVHYLGGLTGLTGVDANKHPTLLFQCYDGGLEGDEFGCRREGAPQRGYNGELTFPCPFTDSSCRQLSPSLAPSSEN